MNFSSFTIAKQDLEHCSSGHTFNLDLIGKLLSIDNNINKKANMYYVAELCKLCRLWYALQLFCCRARNSVILT